MSASITTINGRTAVITGAGSGIGQAVARRLAAHGCPVALADWNETGLEETAASIGGDVLVRRLDQSAPLPEYAHPGDAGADLTTTVDVRLAPGERAVVPTGLALALPDGYAAFVHPRSGLAARHGISIVNAPDR